MIKSNKLAFLAIVFTIATVSITQTASAQKYRTAADTVKLNKEYGDVTLSIARLKADLIEEQNKTLSYQSKTASTAQSAAISAQDSKGTASTATNGNVKDAHTAMKQAKDANNRARDAKNARDDEADNLKKIKDINEKIAKKQTLLTLLAQQKASIIGELQVSAVPKN